MEIVDNLHDDEAVENDHVEVEPATETVEEAAEEDDSGGREEAVEMEKGEEETEQLKDAAVHEAEVMEEDVIQEAVEEVVHEMEVDMAEDAAHLVEQTVEASWPKPAKQTADNVMEKVTIVTGEQVYALKERIAASQEVGTVEQAEAVVDEIRALTDEAHAAMKEVEAPQLQVESDLVEVQVDEPLMVSQLEEQSSVAHSANILQVPDIRIQAPSPIVEQSDIVIAIETPSFEAPLETFEAPMLEGAPVSTEMAAEVAQPATNGIEEGQVGAIDEATEEETLAKTKTGTTLPGQQ